MPYSAQDLVSCHSSGKCHGGNIDTVWDKISTDGIVPEACFPYASKNGSWPECSEKCTTEPAIQTAERACLVMTDDGIKREIKKNGPVVALVPVYSDFLVYSNGVYRPSSDAKKLTGHQAVVIVGWAI